LLISFGLTCIGQQIDNLNLFRKTPFYHALPPQPTPVFSFILIEAR
jgi:hypothetical protein